MGLRDHLRRNQHRAPSTPRSRHSQSPGSIHSAEGRSARPAYGEQSFYTASPPAGLAHAQKVAERPEDVRGVVRLAFCGGKDVGKSALINAVAKCHIAGGRQVRTDGDRFRHPRIQDVVYYEMPTHLAIKMDVKDFKLVIIIFDGNVKDTEVELANKCRLARIPFIFVYTKADLTFRRLRNFSKAPVPQVLKITREAVNDKPSMKWFQLKESDQKVFLLSVPDLARRNIHSIFDEVDFLYYVESFYSTTIPVDTRFTTTVDPVDNSFPSGVGSGQDFRTPPKNTGPSRLSRNGQDSNSGSFENDATSSVNTRGRPISRNHSQLPGSFQVLNSNSSSYLFTNSGNIQPTSAPPLGPARGILKSPSSGAAATGTSSNSRPASLSPVMMPGNFKSMAPSPTPSTSMGIVDHQVTVGSPGRTPYHKANAKLVRDEKHGDSHLLTTPSTATPTSSAGGTPAIRLSQQRHRMTTQSPNPARRFDVERDDSCRGVIPFDDGIKVAFIEDPATGDQGKRATLLEAFLGGSATGKQQSIKSIAPGVGYRHSEYPNAKFFYYDARDDIGAIESVPEFVAKNLSGFGLLILSYTKVLPDCMVQIALLAKQRCVKFLLVHCRPSFKEDQQLMDKGFSPRHPLRKLKELATKDAKSALARAGVKEQDYAVFEISRRLLRLPDSYPRGDEEDFKDIIAENAGGRIGPAPDLLSPPGSQTGTSFAPGRPPTSATFAPSSAAGLSDFSTPISRSSAIVPGRSSGTPQPVLKKPQSRTPAPASQSTESLQALSGSGGRGTPQSVTWLSPQTVHIAVVGHNQVGKSTLINGTFKQNVAIVGKEHQRLPHRHPEYYDLVFEDLPGYGIGLTQQEASRWISKQRLESMDWVIVVFQSRLGLVELQLAQFAEQYQIPLVLVATAADSTVESLMFDENLTERVAVEKTRRRIVTTVRKQLEESQTRQFPLFLVSGKALAQSSDRQQRMPLYFDEMLYLDFIEQELAGSL